MHADRRLYDTCIVILAPCDWNCKSSYIAYASATTSRLGRAALCRVILFACVPTPVLAIKSGILVVRYSPVTMC